MLDPEALPVRAIATVYSEPLWLFYRKRLRAGHPGKPVTRLTQLRNHHIAIGAHQGKNLGIPGEETTNGMLDAIALSRL